MKKHIPAAKLYGLSKRDLVGGGGGGGEGGGRLQCIGHIYFAYYYCVSLT